MNPSKHSNIRDEVCSWFIRVNKDNSCKDGRTGRASHANKGFVSLQNCPEEKNISVVPQTIHPLLALFVFVYVRLSVLSSFHLLCSSAFFPSPLFPSHLCLTACSQLYDSFLSVSSTGFSSSSTIFLFYSICPQCAWQRLVIFNHFLPPVLPHDFSILVWHCSPTLFWAEAGASQCDIIL